MANESSKVFLFSDMIFPPLFEKGPGEGGAPLKHAAGRLDRIIRDRFNDNLALVHESQQDLSPRLEPDLLPDLGRNNDLALGKGFNNRHIGYPKNRMFNITDQNITAPSLCQQGFDTQ